MTQVISTNIRTALIEGSASGNAVNYAHDFTDLLGNVENAHGFFQTLESNLSPTDDGDNLEISSGVAFVKYHKTAGEIGFLKFSLEMDQSIDLSSESDGQYYCFVELDQDKVDDGSDEIDGSDVATLKVDSSLPASGDYLEVCSFTKSGTTLTITDQREMLNLGLGALSIAEQKIPHAKIHEFGLEYASDSLDVDVKGGVYREDGSTASDTNLTLSASTTNYISLDINTGVISNSTSAFEGIALYEATTDASGVSSVLDKRQALIGSQGGGELATTEEALAGTNDTKFMSPLKTKEAIGNYICTFSGCTSDDTETEIFVGGVTDERLDLPANSLLVFDMMLTAHSSANDNLVVRAEGSLERDGSDNTTLRYLDVKYNNQPAGSLIEAGYSGNNFYVGGQEASPVAVYFSADGTKMYAVGWSSDYVRQYNLSTPWDIETANYTQSHSIAAQESNSSCAYFSPDGTKFYLCGSDRIIYQYTLSTPWDISTMSYDSINLNLSSLESNGIYGIYFSPDGKYFYYSGDYENKIYQYELSTAWNISTASDTDNAIDVSSQETSPRGICFSEDGKQLYVAGEANKKVYLYNLDVAWSLASSRYSGQSLDYSSQSTSVRGIYVNSKIGALYTINYANDYVYHYNMNPNNWYVSIKADDTNEALTLKVKGADSTNITWQAKAIIDLNQG